MTNKICVSLVSHGHGEMVQKLVIDLLKLDSIYEIILTLNIPEQFPIVDHKRLKIIKNPEPKGFGGNHNDAFLLTDCEFFCVLNPDIELSNNPFPNLLSSFNKSSIGLVSPVVLSGDGNIEDSMRKFLTPWSLIKRILRMDSGAYSFKQGDSNFSPDWVAGMFMLFRSEAYTYVGGFDARYFMYCEDADICTRLWKAGYKITGCLSVGVIHNAQRASHRSYKHLLWHIQSLLRYFFTHAFSLPRKS